MRTSTKQLWVMMVNCIIDTHIICLALFLSVLKDNVATWISAAAIITALWAFVTIMYNSNNKRKAVENTASKGEK